MLLVGSGFGWWFGLRDCRALLQGDPFDPFELFDPFGVRTEGVLRRLMTYSRMPYPE
jgi:hypothetical protein